jgi:hypothetical protein
MSSKTNIPNDSILGKLNYANLTPKTLVSNGESSNQSNGRRLLPVKLGISDECQHFNQEIKVKISNNIFAYSIALYEIVSIFFFYIQLPTV